MIPAYVAQGLEAQKLEIEALRNRVLHLEEENFRLRLACALFQHKMPARKGGRPRKHTQQDDLELMEIFEFLKRKYPSRTGRQASFAALLRDFATEQKLRLSAAELRKQIKTTQNALSRAKKFPKNPDGLFQGKNRL